MTKKELAEMVASLELQLKNQTLRSETLLTIGLTQAADHKKELVKARKATKRMRNRLVNILDLATVLRTYVDDGFADATNNRILNTIIRLASGR